MVKEIAGIEVLFQTRDLPARMPVFVQVQEPSAAKTDARLTLQTPPQ